METLKKSVSGSFDCTVVLASARKKVKVSGLTFDQLRDNERQKDPFFAMKQ